MSTIRTSRRLLLRLPERPLRDVDRAALGALLVDVGVRALAHGHELLDRGRPLRVACRERDVLPLLAQKAGELGAGGRLARALKPRHQDHRRSRRGEGEVAAGAAHERGQLLVHDLYDLLARIERVQDVRAQAALLHLRREFLDDLEVDVGLEQGETDLAHRLVDVGLGQLAPAANVRERGLKTIAQRVKHALSLRLTLR